MNQEREVIFQATTNDIDSSISISIYFAVVAALVAAILSWLVTNNIIVRLIRCEIPLMILQRATI